MIVVVRAGGTGTRLWPVSRKAHPKQFAQITGEDTLIKRTIERVIPLAGGAHNVYVSVNEDHAETIINQVPQIKRENIIVELSGRNTGPAICLENAVLKARGVADDEVILTIPSDDFIANEDLYRDMMLASERFLKKNPHMIITPGAKPDYLDTGYSFITAGDGLDAEGSIRFTKIGKWTEKPETPEAEELLKNPNVYYHMGMYVWTLGNVLKRLGDSAPAIMNACKEIVQSDDIAKNRALYEAVPKESIETILTKDCPDLVMVSAPSIGWSDIGKWHVVKHVLGEEGNNVTKGAVMTRDTKNSLIYAPEGKTIAVIGLEDVVVVDTGDALLVSNAKDSAEVKKIVEQLDQQGKTELL